MIMGTAVRVASSGTNILAPLHRCENGVHTQGRDLHYSMDRLPRRAYIGRSGNRVMWRLVEWLLLAVPFQICEEGGAV